MNATTLMLAAAGGGTSGFGGGSGRGGGGGGGFTGDDLPGGVLGTVAFWCIVMALGFLLYLWKERRDERRRMERGADEPRGTRPPTAAPPSPTAGAVTSAAYALFGQVQAAWDAHDRERLATLSAPHLMAEWSRHLDALDRLGQRRRVRVLDRPVIEDMGLLHGRGGAGDRIVVRISAHLEQHVETADGERVSGDDGGSADAHIREYWTLARYDERWHVVSIEAAGDGLRGGDDLASPWAVGRAPDGASTAS